MNQFGKVTPLEKRPFRCLHSLSSCQRNDFFFPAETFVNDCFHSCWNFVRKIRAPDLHFYNRSLILVETATCHQINKVLERPGLRKHHHWHPLRWIGFEITVSHTTHTRDETNGLNQPPSYAHSRPLSQSIRSSHHSPPKYYHQCITKQTRMFLMVILSICNIIDKRIFRSFSRDANTRSSLT